jgi:hypothetical protein
MSKTTTTNRPSPAQTALLTHFAMLGGRSTFTNATVVKYGFSVKTLLATTRAGWIQASHIEVPSCFVVYELTDAGRTALETA